MIAAFVMTSQVAAAQEPPTRDLARINWMEFREWVPAKVQTVLLPLGTLEPHGVTANGADIIAPVAIASAIAPRLNAFIAPVVPYGITGGMDAYPGAFTIPEAAYRPYVRAVLEGLAAQGFRNVILFGYDGGHAAENETAFMQAIDPALVHRDRYTGPDMVTPNAAPGTYSAYPSPSSITLYKDGEGYPTFDEAKAKEYFARVNDKVASLVEDIIRKWNLAGVRP